MQAVILAAGAGLRLRDRDRRPKCLIPVGGVPMVEHQLAMLAATGITDVLVVVGHARDQVRALLGDRVRYADNEAFATTNSLYSFLLAARHVREETLVLNCDVFLHPRLVERLADADGDALLYDSSSGDDAEHMKVRVEGGRLVDMAKSLPSKHVSGENVGMLRMLPETVLATGRHAREILAGGRRKAWLAEAVRRVCRDRDVECLDVATWPWVEIDFPEDLERAERSVLPAVSPALADLDLALSPLSSRRNA